ncbi:SAM-dependent methyltransferase, partial [Candidatus Pelagibacter ubique]|nr:SAM-dependent methyltransferase [Candidatus Pelagibacter ubique]
IFNKIKRNNGGILIIDYAYTDKKMKNTLQAVSKHKYCDVLKGFGNSDITYNLSFSLLNRIVKELSSLTSMNTTQGEFLTKLGILERVEILSKKMLFSEKAEEYHSLLLIFFYNTANQVQYPQYKPKNTI